MVTGIKLSPKGGDTGQRNEFFIMHAIFTPGGKQVRQLLMKIPLVCIANRD